MDDQEKIIVTKPPVPAGLVIAERIIYFIIGVIEILLAFRFGLSLLGANRGHPFANFIFTSTDGMVQPFLNLFNYQTALGISRFEFEAIVAMIVYGILGTAIIAVLRLPRSPA